MIDTYEINKYTLAIIPLSTNTSRVIEEDDIFDFKYLLKLLVLTSNLNTI